MVSRATPPKRECKYCSFSMSLSLSSFPMTVVKVASNFNIWQPRFPRSKRKIRIISDVNFLQRLNPAIVFCNEQPSLGLVSPSHPWKPRQIQSDGRYARHSINESELFPFKFVYLQLRIQEELFGFGREIINFDKAKDVLYKFLPIWKGPLLSKCSHTRINLISY